jgi:hypothetical protein
MQECASGCRDDVEICGSRDEYLDGDLAPEGESRGGLWPWEESKFMMWGFGVFFITNNVLVMIHSFSSPLEFVSCRIWSTVAE